MRKWQRQLLFAPLIALIALGLGLGLALGGVRALAWLGEADGRTELLVFGIDGADWAVIDRLVERGELPHLAALQRRGVRARLRTIEPMISPRIWTTIATGKLPEKHGVEDFYAISTMVRARRFWDIAERAGLRIGVFGWPTTWPPHEVDGFLVPGWMARGPETHPPELGFLKQLEAAGRARRSVGVVEGAGWALRGLAHGFSIETLGRAVGASRGGPDRYPRLADSLYRIETDVFVHLLAAERPELAVFYSDVVDKVSHRYWQPEPLPTPPGEVPAPRAAENPVEHMYRLSDWALGRLLSTVDERTAVAVMSDHGFRSVDRVLMTRLLLLADRALERAGFPELRAFKVTDKVYVRSPQALADGPAILERARRAFAAAVHEPSGGALFAVGGEAADGFSLALAGAGLKNLESDPVRIAGERFRLGDITSRRVGRGMHRDPGIFVLACESCRKGEDILELHVSDVAPTLLHLLGLPVGDDMDGRVVLDVFDREFQRSQKIASVATHDDGLETQPEPDTRDPRLEQILRSVGYVD